MSVSYAYNLLAQMLDFRKCIESTWCWFLSLQGLLRNQSIETILVCIVVLHFPHVWWMPEIKSAERLSQALVHFVIARASCFYGPPKNQGYQYEPNIDISEQLVSKLWTILQQIPFLLLWIRGRQSMVFATLCSCWVVLFASSQYLPTHVFASLSML